MKLSQALKLKNRLAGELVRNNQILQRENTKRSDNPSQVNPEAVWNNILNLSNQLGELKAKISAANVPIYDKIERMAELKSRIAFVQQLPKRDTPEIQFVGRDQEKVEYTWTPYINQEKCDALVAEYQKQIDTYQDEIDKFNATTDI